MKRLLSGGSVRKRFKAMNVRSFFMLGRLWLAFLFSGCAGIKESDSDILLNTLVPLPIQTVSEEDSKVPSVPLTNKMESLVRSNDQMVLIYIPNGEFLMGSSESQINDAIAMCNQHYSPCNHWFYEREGPQHTVSVDAYWIDQTEVSNTQYRLCVEQGICDAPTTCRKGVPIFDNPETADHPVVCVDWDDAQTYCEWAGARLPTEAEWEYAFRGISSSIYPWGDEFDGSRTNYCDVNCSQSYADERFDDGYSQTAPVKSYPSGVSWAGVHNMSGNVSEWIADWFGEYSLEPVSNPMGAEIGTEKMIKGCSWFYNPVYCRGALRPAAMPEISFDYLGFRCALSADVR